MNGFWVVGLRCGVRMNQMITLESIESIIIILVIIITLEMRGIVFFSFFLLVFIHVGFDLRLFLKGS